MGSLTEDGKLSAAVELSCMQLPMTMHEHVKI